MKDEYYLPPLMEFPNTLFPKISHTIRNFFFARLLIAPYFDQDFSIKDFSSGASKSASMVSQCLSNGDLESLVDLLTPDCINEIKKNLSLFSLPQRSALAVSTEDVYFSHTHQIGILMEDHPTEEDQYIRHVECTWVGHTFPNYQSVMEECGGDPRKIKEYLSERGGPIILNYRFIRDYTKGVEDSWTINAVNHFRLYEIDS